MLRLFQNDPSVCSVYFTLFPHPGIPPDGCTYFGHRDVELGGVFELMDIAVFS